MRGARGRLDLPPGHGPDLEERFLKYSVLVWELWLIVSSRSVPQTVWFRPPRCCRTDSSIVGDQPAAAEQQARTERGKKDWSTSAARLPRSTQQSFVQCPAARASTEISG